MGKVKYKEFTKEEEKIYDDAIAELRKKREAGMKFKEACMAMDVKDKELHMLIAEDFLKISIAEMHHSRRMPFEEIAKELDLPIERIVVTYQKMLEDIVNTHKGAGFSAKDLGFSEPKGNA